MIDPEENPQNQLITLSAQLPGGALENITYAYPAGANNGKITSMSDTVSGESVAYAYDSLNRLLTAGGGTVGASPTGTTLLATCFRRPSRPGRARACLRR